MNLRATGNRQNRSTPATEFDHSFLLSLYERMVLLRRFEQLAQMACRKGETPGFFHLYIGEEATAVGVCANLRPSDWVTSTHRGHGHALAKGMDPKVLMAELYGKRDGCCGGRGGTMHLYDRSIGLFGTNGIVAAGIGHATGAGISARVRGSDNIGVAFFGDGAVNHGGFHEAVNFAGIQQRPVVFVCENNLYATATPFTMTTLNAEVASKAAAYGIPGVAVDGNDVLAVLRAARDAVERARCGDGPTLIEAKTYRTVGHHEGDPVTGTYRTQAEVDAWAKRDPIALFRARLNADFGVAADELDPIDAARRSCGTGSARLCPRCRPSRIQRRSTCTSTPIRSIRRLPLRRRRRLPRPRRAGWTPCATASPRRCVATPHILYFGEGTGERGGTFAHTKNLFQEFGGKRMIDTPISRTGLHQHGARRFGDRSADDCRPYVCRLPVRSSQSDRPSGGQAPLHE